MVSWVRFIPATGWHHPLLVVPSPRALAAPPPAPPARPGYWWVVTPDTEWRAVPGTPPGWLGFFGGGTLRIDLPPAALELFLTLPPAELPPAAPYDLLLAYEAKRLLGTLDSRLGAALAAALAGKTAEQLCGGLLVPAPPYEVVAAWVSTYQRWPTGGGSSTGPPSDNTRA